MMQSGNGSAKPNGKVPKSERFELACAISTISNSQEKFIAAVDTLKGFSDDVLRELDLEIEAKKYEVDRLDDEFKRNLKDGQIQTDQAIAEYKYSAALDILKERQETPIAQAELQKLNSSLAELRAERATELDALRKEERERAHQQLAAAIKVRAFSCSHCGASSPYLIFRTRIWCTKQRSQRNPPP